MYQFETKYLCNAATFVLIQGTAVVFKKYLVFLKLFSFIFNIDFASISFLLNAVMTFFFPSFSSYKYVVVISEWWGRKWYKSMELELQVSLILASNL